MLQYVIDYKLILNILINLMNYISNQQLTPEKLEITHDMLSDYCKKLQMNMV